MEQRGVPGIITCQNAALNLPLAFDPGERWDYGIGIDWLGQVVEVVDGRKIDRFCREEIFDPLYMVDTRFEVEDHMASRLATVSSRGEDGKFSDFAIAPPSNPEFYGMGHALYSTAPDFMSFLRMYLNKGQLDGKRLLSEQTVQFLLSNHIGDLKVGMLKTVVPAITADAEFFPGRKKAQPCIYAHRGRRSGNAVCWLAVLGRCSEYALLVRS
jgi:methyl acetate hydrolase